MSDVTHYAGLTFWGPYDDRRVDGLLARLDVAAGARVLDVGCGNAEVLLRLAQRYGACVTGVDHSAHALGQARAAFAERAPDANATFLQQDAKTAPLPPGPFDAIVWLGGPFLGESFDETVRTFAEMLSPGGRLLLGHGFWMQPPPAAYVEATGIPADEMTDHAGNIDIGIAHGLRLHYCGVSSRDEWDHFEGTIRDNRERTGDDRGRAFYLAQQRWGRDTMGFGLYLFTKPR